MELRAAHLITKVVKLGRPKRINPRDQLVTPKQRAGGEPKRRASKPIIGTAAHGKIKVIYTKMVRVFATRFAPDLDAETLSDHLTTQLGHVVRCECIVTVSNRYSSFKVCAECKDVMEMYNPEIWPEGSVVRRYYEPRKSGETGDGRARLVAGPNVSYGTTAAQPN